MPETETERFDVGVIGVGRHARTCHIPTLMGLRDEGVNVVAVARRDRDQAREIADEFGVRGVYGSLEEMIAAESTLGGVVIASPHAAHAEHALAALAAGLHVLVEKPLATTPSQGQAMVTAAERHGVVLAVAYQYPWMVDDARRAIEAGAIGVVRRVHGGWRRRDGIPDRPEFWNSADTGGVAIDLLGHLLSALLHLLGDSPVWLTAQTWNDVGRRRYGSAFGAEDTAWVTLRCERGIRTELKLSWATEIGVDEEIGLTVEGSSGTLEIPLMSGESDPEDFRPALHYRIAGEAHDEIESMRFGGPSPPTTRECFKRQTRNWVAACRGQEQLLFSAEQALRVQRVLSLVRLSAQSGGLELGPLHQ